MTNMTNLMAFQIHGGGLGGGLVDMIVGLLTFLESLYGKTPPEMFAIIMPGLVDLENIHPVLVHYPIAFFTAFFLLDLLGTLAKKPQWRYVAGWLLYLGALASVFTVVAGLFAADSVEHGEDVHGLMEQHEHLGIAILSLSLFLAGLRLKHWFLHSYIGHAFSLTLAGVLFLLVSLAADLGGTMVYRHGVSVKQQIPVVVSNPPIDSAVDNTPSSVPAPVTDPSQAGHSHAHGGHHHHHSH